MAIEPLVGALVLLAALLHASWNALLKSGGDPLTRLVLVNASGALCMLPLLAWVDFPDPASWPWLIGSVLVHQAYYLFLILGYRDGDLSLVYPIARGIAPLLVALGAWLVAGERLSIQGMLAVVLVSLAILSLAGERRQGIRPQRSVVYALCTGATIAVYTVLDGMGGRLSGDVLGYIVWLFLLEGGLILIVMLALRGRRLLIDMWRHRHAGMLGGLFSAIAYGLVIWAMSHTPMTYVSALRETSVIAAAIIGTWLLREPFGRRRIGAAVTVVAGVVLLQLSRAA